MHGLGTLKGNTAEALCLRVQKLILTETVIVNMEDGIQCENAAEAVNVNLEDEVEFAKVRRSHECLNIEREFRLKM